MNRTPIEWVKNPDGTQGYTWNPITGCLNGCPYCYARKLANGRLKQRYLANTNVGLTPMTDKWAQAINNPFFPRFWEDRIEELITRNNYLDGDLPRPTKPKGIFVCDMSDLFGIGVPEEWTRRVLDTIDWNKYYDRFYLLTKQYQNLAQFSPYPDNCRVGVTATNQVMWNEALRYLTDIKAMIKYVSIEPYLERIVPEYTLMLKSGIKQVIIGAQTKPTKLPKWEWVSEIIEACDKAGISVFLKNNLVPMLKSVDYILPTNIAMGAALRQEMPEGR